MKIKYFIILPFFILTMSFLSSLKGYSQLAGNDWNPFSRNYLESLIINTDRDIYITGEQLLCEICKTRGYTGEPSDFSKLIYLELLDELNIPVIQIKIWAGDSYGTARFRIPDTFTSGNFVLRAYTSWMKNYSPDQFAYKMVTIINPFKGTDKLLFSPPVIEKDSTSVMNVKGPMVTFEMNESEGGAGNKIKVESDKTNYSLREKVKLKISKSDGKRLDNSAILSVSVIKSFLANESRDELILNQKNKDVLVFNKDNPSFLPEPEGEIIKGVIRNKEDGEPLRNIGISVSFVGKNPVCQFSTTNQNGEFIFVVRELYGPNELVIQPISPGSPASTVELVQPFSGIFSDISPVAFLPDSNQINDINKAIIAMQVTAIYEPLREINRLISPGRGKIDFYGKPARRVVLSDYIELTDVREVVKEILTEVAVIKNNKEVTLRVLSRNPYEEFRKPALVLVDGVPFYDIEKLLAVKAGEMESIDIINTRYFYAGYTFEGMVSFVSKKGNLSVLDFDDKVYRRVFEGCQQPSVFYSPDYSVDTLKNSRIPDFRNTLYWNPEITFSSRGDAIVEFYTSDEPGDFSIKIEGIDGNGNKVYFTSPLIVR